ncbi:hypothetical protein [Aeromonas bestiarum]
MFGDPLFAHEKEPQLRLFLTVNMPLNKLSVSAMKKIVKKCVMAGN